MERHKLKVVVYMLLVRNNEALLIRRWNTGWQDGNYTLPAGHLEQNETLSNAVVREVLEEVGVVVKPEDAHHIHTIHRMNTHIDVFFMCTNWEGEPYNAEVNKCDDIKWFPINNLPDNIVPFIKQAISLYQNSIGFSEFDTVH